MKKLLLFVLFTGLSGLLVAQTKIMSSLKDEIEKVAQEQLDTDYHIGKTGVMTPFERNIGSNI